MIGRIKLGVLALVAMFALVVAFRSPVVADDKKEDKSSSCAKCAAVAKVLDAARCDKCPKDKHCEACEKHCKDMMAKAPLHCDACAKDGKCDACTKAFEDAKKAHKGCEFCAAKACIIADTGWCCNKCKAANKVDCPKCQEARKPIESIKCATCDKDKK